MPTAPAKSATGNLSGFMPADAAELAERKVSRYQSARDNRGKPIALVEILEAIQAGHWEKPVAAIREALAAGDTAKAETLKTQLEGFTVSGVFAPTRAKINLKEPTGCIILDVDHLASTAEAEAARDTLGDDPHVLAAFVSPSGRGVKAVVYVGTCPDDGEAKSAWRALAEYLATTYSIQTDPSGKDVCRLCFVSHDPGAIIRTGAVRPFTARAEAPKPAAPKVQTVCTSKPSTTPDDAVIRSAVAVLDAGCSRADWLAVACSIKNALGDSGFQIFDSWSATAPEKYDAGETRKLWDTITAGGGVTVGTLFHRAEDAGWINPTGRLALSIRRQQAAEKAPATKEPAETSEDAIRAKLWSISATPALTTRDRNKAYCDAVVGWLHLRGKFYHLESCPDFGGALYFDGIRKILQRIRSDAFTAWLSDALALNRGDRVFQLVSLAVETESLSPRSSGIEPATYWASRGKIIYLSNGPGEMVRISSKGVTTADNGTDGILFESNAVLPTWKLTDPANPFEACSLFRDMATAAPHGKLLFALWAASLPTDQRTKPPIVCTSPVGGGKTRTVAGIFRFYGLPERISGVLKTGESDFWTAMNAGGLTCLDNADTKIDWIPDAVASAATGGCQVKRRLYTDRDEVILRARSWLAITSANPSFASDAGLADRLLVVRMNRRTGETAESKLDDEIDAARDAGLSWICHSLRAALADDRPVPGGLNHRHPDFADLAVRLGRAIGREAEAVAAMQAAEVDKSLFNLENDSIAAVILEILRDGQPFTGTAAELLDRLKTADPSLESRLSVKRLSARISKLWPHMEGALRAERETIHGGALKYTLHPPEAGDMVTCKQGFPVKSLRGENIRTLPETVPWKSPSHQDAPIDSLWVEN
jgi:hypothetical protein